MFKILFIIFFLIVLLPILFLYFVFAFPPTRKLIGYFLKNKIQNMSQNGHVYYRTYHYNTGNEPNIRHEKDVTPRPSSEKFLE